MPFQHWHQMLEAVAALKIIFWSVSTTLQFYCSSFQQILNILLLPSWIIGSKSSLGYGVDCAIIRIQILELSKGGGFVRKFTGRNFWPFWFVKSCSKSFSNTLAFTLKARPYHIPINSHLNKIQFLICVNNPMMQPLVGFIIHK